MSIVWTPAGIALQIELREFVIRDCTCDCDTCGGTGFIGEKRRVWDCCPGFPDNDGWCSCPNEELQEEGPITYFFELEDGGGGGFEACLDCGPKFRWPAIQRGKVEAYTQGAEPCPDCRHAGGFNTGKTPKFELLRITPERVVLLARATNRGDLQSACLSLVLTYQGLSK